jgi:hypothetical protein
MKGSNNHGRINAELRERLESSFERLLRPERVRKVEITKVEGTKVLGFLLTSCPVERLEHWKDFEARLATDKGGSIVYAVVDGKRLVAQTVESSRRPRLVARESRS